MKKYLFSALGSLALMAAFTSCSGEEQKSSACPYLEQATVDSLSYSKGQSVAARNRGQITDNIDKNAYMRGFQTVLANIEDSSFMVGFLDAMRFYERDYQRYARDLKFKIDARQFLDGYKSIFLRDSVKADVLDNLVMQEMSIDNRLALEYMRYSDEKAKPFIEAGEKFLAQEAQNGLVIKDAPQGGHFAVVTPGNGEALPTDGLVVVSHRLIHTDGTEIPGSKGEDPMPAAQFGDFGPLSVGAVVRVYSNAGMDNPALGISAGELVIAEVEVVGISQPGAMGGAAVTPVAPAAKASAEAPAAPASSEK